MNAFIKYLIEANLGLIFFYLIYLLSLRNENQFTVKRVFLLLTLISSIAFPLFHFNLLSGAESLPSVSKLLESNWLPAVTVPASSYQNQSVAPSAFDPWLIIGIVYASVASLLMLVLLFRIITLLRLFRNATTYSWNNCTVSESDELRPTFSFFTFIFIGQASRLTEAEKCQVLDHEMAHVRKIHSLDLLMANVISVFFWFNPFTRLYKRAIIEVHEFEADQDVVKNKDIDGYCALLASLALKTSEFPLAHHFGNSIILKRIKMMRSMKRKIQSWKLCPILFSALLFFFVVACQETSTPDLDRIVQNSTLDETLPDDIKTIIAKLKQDNPKKDFIIVENTSEGKKTVDLLYKNASKYDIDLMVMHLLTTKPGKGLFGFFSPTRKFSVLETGKFTEHTDKVYMAVETTASPEGGMALFQEYLMKHLQYPELARKLSVEGRSLISFVVNRDGKLSDFKVLESMDSQSDERAIDLIASGPKWKPATQEGAAVLQRMIVPIDYKLPKASVIVTAPDSNDFLMEVSVSNQRENGKTKIEGTVKDQRGKPLSGAHAVVRDSTDGTVTDSNGHFTFNTMARRGSIVVTFTGFKPVEYRF